MQTPKQVIEWLAQAGAAVSGGSRAIRLAATAGPATPAWSSSPPLVLAWPGLGDVLPDGGLPRGVVEFASPSALGGGTSLALAGVRAGQSRSLEAWCAWLDPEATLHAPGVVAAGVDLARMLVVRPPRAQLARVAVKLVASAAFEVVVIDMDAIAGARSIAVDDHELEPSGGGDRSRGRVRPRRASEGESSRSPSPRTRGWAPEVLVRKLALAAEPGGTTVMLLTDSSRPRAAVWPVALRLELARPSRGHLRIRVAKDRHGRMGLAKTVPFHPVTRAAI